MIFSCCGTKDAERPDITDVITEADTTDITDIAETLEETEEVTEPETEPETEAETEPPEEIVPVSLPVLMYHHFTEDTSTKHTTVVTKNRFTEQIAALKNAGFNAVTADEVISYVEGNCELPENPILITMDDGYTSNVTIAAPILKEYGMNATVFVIGVYAGREINVHTGNLLFPPRFGGDEAEMSINDGTLFMQSHTYDMHRLISEGFSLRDGVLMMDGESEEEYRAALQKDIEDSVAELEADFGTEASAFSYPYGYCSDIADEVLKEAGIKLTVTTAEGVAIIEKYNPDSLWRLPRINVTNWFTADKLLAKIEDLMKSPE